MIYLVPIVLIIISLFLIKGKASHSEAGPSIILIGLIIGAIGIILLMSLAIRDGLL